MLTKIFTEVLCPRTQMTVLKNKLLTFSVILRLCWVKHTVGVLWWFYIHFQDGRLTGLCS